MGPEGVGNDSISQIAKESSEGLLVTLPKSFDQDPANVALADAFKAKKKTRAARSCSLPTRRLK